MTIKKSINVKDSTIQALEERFPDVPFTKLVEQGLKLLLDPTIMNKKVVLQDDIMAKFDRLCERTYEIHKEFVHK